MKKRNKRILGLFSGILALTCSVSLLFEGVENVEAATRLYGVQQVVENISSEDPFVILELVPDEAFASFGNYVVGQETEIDSRLLELCESGGQRREKILQLLTGLIVEEDENGNGFNTPLYYNFNTLYEEQISEPEDLTGWKVLEYQDEAGNLITHTEERLGYYKEVASGEGDYTLSVSNQNVITVSDESEEKDVAEESNGTETPDESVDLEETETPDESVDLEETETPDESGDLEETETPDESVDLEETETPDESGDLEETETPDGLGESEETETPDESGESEETETPDESGESEGTENSGESEGLELVESPVQVEKSVQFVQAQTPNDQNNGSDTEVGEDTGTGDTKEVGEDTGTGDTKEVGEDTGTGNVKEGENNTEIIETYDYTPKTGNFVWVEANSADADSSLVKEYSVTFEKLYYKVTITSNDWFAKSVLESTELSNNIKVLTVTPKELESNISQGYLAEEGNVKIKGWNEVDLLYISDSTCLNLTDDERALFDTYTDSESTDLATVYTNDISAQTGYNIYQYVLNTSLPVIVDSNLITDVTQLPNEQQALNTNLQKLVFLLRDYTTETIPEFYKTADGSVIDVSSWATAWPTGLSDILLTNVASKTFGTKGSVQGSVYFNSGSNMLNAAFATVFSSVGIGESTTSEAYTTAEGILTGITAVISEIDSENFYNEVNKVDYTTEYNKNENQIQISQSSVVKYILSYAYRRATVYKDKITVLDLEPTKYSTLTEDTIRGWLKEEDFKRIQKIDIVQMTTSEFIGVLTDLNAEYDLIYIGDCIGPAGDYQGRMNRDPKTGRTDYNDNAMDGLIYSHTGDEYTTDYRFGGLLNKEYQNNNRTSDIRNTNFIARFSGNDITEEKMEELKDFVNSGYPVVVANNFITTNTDGKRIVDSTYVDNSSYLYEFMDYFTTKSPKDNLMSDENLNASSMFATYLNMSKLYLSMISWPTEYKVIYDDRGEYIDSVQYLEDNNGKYALEYTFEFSDNSEAKLDSIDYKVELFVDINADGRHDATEELDGLIVREVETGKEVSYDKLTTGVRYTVVRELPDGYVGMIPWKLEITQKTASDSTGSSNSKIVHTSTKGYTAVPSKDVTKIKVLQINAATKRTTTTTGRPPTTTTTTITNTGLILREDDNSTFAKLIKNVEKMMNYDIEITPVPVYTYIDEYNKYVAGEKEKNPSLSDIDAYTGFYEWYFSPYDMVIIGFTDKYEGFESNGATMALRLFIESGRSVMFSHDATSFVNAPEDQYPNDNTYWGYYFNKNIRPVVGMDRYGVTDDDLSQIYQPGNELTLTGVDAGYYEDIQEKNKDVAYKANSNRQKSEHEVHGFTSTGMILRDEIQRENQMEDVYYKDTSQNGASRVDYITQVNKGQITTFPFDINVENLYKSGETEISNASYQVIERTRRNVATTHSQYYQLDLKFDKTNDGKSDIVVWYCLADKMYDAIPNDVRNNYYIYSVGNITYSGLGHSGNSIKLDEAKLFVNTMIASYNAGKKDPTIAIVQDSANKSVIKHYSYRPYDKEIGLVDTSNEVINFYVTDNNIIHGEKSIALKYYVQIADSVYDANNPSHTMITENGTNVYLRQLSESEIADADSIVASNEIGTVALDSELFSSAFADENTGSVKIYISAQTTLTHSTGKVETTGTAFTSITVKALEMFDLD